MFVFYLGGCPVYWSTSVIIVISWVFWLDPPAPIMITLPSLRAPPVAIETKRPKENWMERAGWTTLHQTCVFFTAFGFFIYTVHQFRCHVTNHLKGWTKAVLHNLYFIQSHILLYSSLNIILLSIWSSNYRLHYLWWSVHLIIKTVVVCLTLQNLNLKQYLRNCKHYSILQMEKIEHTTRSVKIAVNC